MNLFRLKTRPGMGKAAVFRGTVSLAVLGICSITAGCASSTATARQAAKPGAALSASSPSFSLAEVSELGHPAWTLSPPEDPLTTLGAISQLPSMR
jgi:hypothetical protein